MDEVKKGRILVVGDLVTPTGFSRVNHSLIKYWQDEYEIVGVGVNYHGDPHDYKFPIFPAYNGKSIYGENRVIDLLNARDFDVLFILNDAWVIDRYLAAIKKEVKKMLPKIIVYFPVDAAQHNPEWYANFDIVSQAVTYTRFGQWVVGDTNPVLDVKVIPHGVDNEIFYKKYPTRLEAKKEFFKDFVDKIDLNNSFIVLNANRNQPRKRLNITMEGFAKFAKNKPVGVKLYMHCGIVDASINLDTLSSRYGISDRLIITGPPRRGVQSVPDWRLNEIYNVCDVGINTGMGEGWGLPNVEHASTGAVQLVPNHSACRELFTGCGLIMNTYGDYMFDNSMTVGRLVNSDEVAQKLEYLYRNPDERDKLAQAGYEKFTNPEYSWKVIAETWIELFRGLSSNDISGLPNEHKGSD